MVFERFDVLVQTSADPSVHLGSIVVAIHQFATLLLGEEQAPPVMNPQVYAEASRRRGNRVGVDGLRDESASHQRISSWYAAANGAVPVADLRRTSFAYARWWCSAPEHQPAGRAESC
jgi:hypothetical protein